ncbi:hypothetical protein B296_00043621 [Ensete ventricosum]|uniref:Uncharacterized protein n=1 Tax=Ensete ventricosum TaxID=4639 RepID=A0A426XCF7_ENSVE|nr:hypothetical protein B296_00043621 [Ensete ventricosum]
MCKILEKEGDDGFSDEEILMRGDKEGGEDECFLFGCKRTSGDRGAIALCSHWRKNSKRMSTTSLRLGSLAETALVVVVVMSVKLPRKQRQPWPGAKELLSRTWRWDACVHSAAHTTL